MFASGPGSHSMFRTSQTSESDGNRLNRLRFNWMHGETHRASAVRLFTTQFNSRKCPQQTAAYGAFVNLIWPRFDHYIWPHPKADRFLSLYMVLDGAGWSVALRRLGAARLG